MKIFLTGATGFVGSQLTKCLVLLGHSVTILIRPNSKLDCLNDVINKIDIYYYDGTYDSLVNALEKSKAVIICHLASLFITQHKPDDVRRLIDSNVSFPCQLLEAMSQLGIKQFINTATSWQHYQSDNYNPVNLYAATKEAFESLQTYYVEAHGLKVINLKLFDTYGPGDSRPKLFNLLRKAAKSGEVLQMSPGEQILDLVYIEDVLNAFIISIERMPKVVKTETYGVSTGLGESLQNIVRVYSMLVGKVVNVNWGGLPYRQREVLNPWDKCEVLPGWRAKIELNSGICHMERDPCIGGLLAVTHA